MADNISNRQVKGITVGVLFTIIGSVAGGTWGVWTFYNNIREGDAARDVRITTLEKQVVSQQNQINELETVKSEDAVETVRLRDQVEELQQRLKDR